MIQAKGQKRDSQARDNLILTVSCCRRGQAIFSYCIAFRAARLAQEKGGSIGGLSQLSPCLLCQKLYCKQSSLGRYCPKQA